MPYESTFTNLTAVPLSTILMVIWLVMICLFLGHWLIASYHWHTYGSERSTSLLAITIYGVGGLMWLLAMGGVLLIL